MTVATCQLWPLSMKPEGDPCPGPTPVLGQPSVRRGHLCLAPGVVGKALALLPYTPPHATSPHSKPLVFLPKSRSGLVLVHVWGPGAPPGPGRADAGGEGGAAGLGWAGTAGPGGSPGTSWVPCQGSFGAVSPLPSPEFLGEELQLLRETGLRWGLSFAQPLGRNTRAVG